MVVAGKGKQELENCNGPKRMDGGSGGMLQGEVAVGDAQGEIFAGVFDRNGGVVVVDEGEDVDTFVLAGLERIAQEFPEIESQLVLFRNKTKPLGYAVVYNVVPVAGKGLEVSEQVINQLMQGDLDPAVGGFEG
jgi:hypothetical protein